MGFIKKVLLVIAFIGIFGLGTFVENKLGIFEPGFDFVSGLFGDKYTLDEAIVILNDEKTLENFSVDLDLEMKTVYLDDETNKKVTETLGVSVGVDVILDMEDTMNMQVMIDLSFSSKGDSTKALLDSMLESIKTQTGYDLSKGASVYLELNILEVIEYAMGVDGANLDSVKCALKTTDNWEDETENAVMLVETLLESFGNSDLELTTESETEGSTDMVTADMFKENSDGTYTIIGKEDTGVVLSLKKGISLVYTSVEGDYDKDGYESTLTVSATLTNIGKVKIDAPIAS